MLTLNTWRLAGIATALLVALPLLAILTGIAAPIDDVWQHLQSTILTRYIGNTLLLMLFVGLLAGTIGVVTAWLVAAYEFPGKGILNWALMLPMAAPAYITAYVYTDLLDVSGPVQQAFRQLTGLEAGQYPDLPIRSLGGAAVILALVLYPYVYLITRAAFAQRSRTLLEAARSLGATPARAFWRVGLPAARPAIAGGLALVLMETLADFGVVDYFGIPTFSTGIFRTWLAMGEKTAAIKLAAVMFVFVMALVALEKYSRKGQVSNTHNRDAGINSIQLRGGKAWIATICCTLPVILGCIIPIGTLLALSLDTQSSADNFSYAVNTLHVSAVAVVITVAAGLLLSLNQRFNKGPVVTTITQISTLGYALPGALLAIGLLLPLSYVDRWLAHSLQTQLGWNTGLLLTGSTVVVIYAYIVRFLTVAFSTTHSGLSQIPTAYDETARSLGASSGRLLRQIHIPLLRRSLVVAALLVFVDCVRELPATLLLRPFNFETLATRVYRLAGDERLAEASTASLMIVVIGLIPVLLLTLGDPKSAPNN